MAKGMSVQHTQPVPSIPVAGRPGGGFGSRGRGAPVEKPKNFSKTMRRLWQYVRYEKKMLLTVFIAILIDSALLLLIPFLIGKAIDAISLQEKVNFSLLEWAIAFLFLAYFADAILTFLQGWLMAGVSQRIVSHLRTSSFNKLQRLPISFFDRHTHGEVMSRFTNDIDNVSSSIAQATTSLMSGVVVIFGSFVMMLILSPLLTLASLITIPLVFLLSRTVTKKTSIFFREQQKQLGQLNGFVEETISGLEVVKAFNHEQQVITDFEKTNIALRDVGLKAQIWSGFLMPLLNVITNLGFAVVAVVGGILALKGLVTIGAIASFITYSRQFGRPLNDIANVFNTLQSGVAGAERVFDILDQQEEVEDRENAIALNNPQGHVVFNQVGFGYQEDIPILKNIHFDAPIGSSTALIGPTGAGKTTIVNLLTRFYDVTTGQILLDGHDIRDYTRDSLRKCFGFVLQDTYLFSGTVKENILYGRPDATDAEVKEAAKLANADPFIRRLPQQYDTILSENGGNLSQGQCQLLAIARVFLARPAILILDEATSSIDTRTEIHIQEALLTLMKGRTSFIIAHRLNTIRGADTIIVIENGTITEQGSHQELLAKKGWYADMLTKQFQFGKIY